MKRIEGINLKLRLYFEISLCYVTEIKSLGYDDTVNQNLTIYAGMIDNGAIKSIYRIYRILWIISQTPLFRHTTSHFRSFRSPAKMDNLPTTFPGKFCTLKHLYIQSPN